MECIMVAKGGGGGGGWTAYLRAFIIATTSQSGILHSFLFLRAWQVGWELDIWLWWQHTKSFTSNWVDYIAVGWVFSSTVLCI